LHICLSVSKVHRRLKEREKKQVNKIGRRDAGIAGKGGRGLTGPFPCGGFVSRPVSFIDMRDFGDKWVIGIRICEHRTNREEDYPRSATFLSKPMDPAGRVHTFGDRKSRGPLITEDVKTNTAVGVDIWMIDSCREVYLPTSERCHT